MANLIVKRFIRDQTLTFDTLFLANRVNLIKLEIGNYLDNMKNKKNLNKANT